MLLFMLCWMFFHTCRLLEVDVSINRLCILPSGFLHLTKLQKLIATKNYLEKLFDEESGMLAPVISVTLTLFTPRPDLARGTQASFDL